jgi:hypothetical protein
MQVPFDQLVIFSTNLEPREVIVYFPQLRFS